MDLLMKYTSQKMIQKMLKKNAIKFNAAVCMMHSKQLLNLQLIYLDVSNPKIFNCILKDVISYINVVMRRNNKNIVLSLKNKDKNINFELNNNLYKHFKTLTLCNKKL